MAEPDYGTASWAPLTTGSGHQGAELAAPLLSAHAPFQQQLPPLYGSLYLPMNSHPISQNRNVPDGPAGSQLQQDRSPYPPMGSRYPYYPPQVFSYQFTGPPRPPPAFWNGPEQLHPDQSFSNTSNTMQGYQPIPAPGTPPQRHQLPETLNAGGPPFARRRYDQRNAVEALARNSHAGGIRTPHHGNRDSAPEDRLQSTRLQPHEHRQPNDQTRPASGYRPWMSPGDHGRRSDRSISPRTSNRRNFERYSVDLSPSSTSSDAEEAAARAPPPSRMRHRPREVRPRFAGYRPHIDPNIATPRQIQELKDGLPRRLPSELPDDASKACDICQKDYSSSHVSPTEEEEIAVVLSCGHSFGEFCIFQWFDTCRTHKNKVTCPMCRKQLIETPRYLQTMVHAFPRNGQAFVDLLAREQLLINGIPRDFHNL